MKTIRLFFFASPFFGGIANAQITKGKWIVGGSGNFSSETQYSTIDDFVLKQIDTSWIQV